MESRRVKNLIKAFYPYAKSKLGFKNPAKVQYIEDDEENSNDPFGRTAHYDPSSATVTLYTHNRHPKDILRSFAHELTHHSQHCRGDLESDKLNTEDGYAQKDSHMRNMEKEAYESGLLVRDWTDTLADKEKQELLMENDEKEVRKTKKTLEDNKAIDDLYEERRMRINKKLTDQFTKSKKNEDKK